VTNGRSITEFLRAVAAKWSRDQILSHGAALAYYAIFSLAPLLVVVIAIAGFVVGRATVQDEILRQVATHVTAEAAAMIEAMIQRFSSPRSGLVASALGVLSMLIGATGVFGHLQATLDYVWEVPRERGGGVWGFVRKRLVSFVLVLVIGAMLLTTMVLSDILTATMERLEAIAPATAPLLGPANFSLSLLIAVGAFALAFRTLPAAQVEWRDVWLGSILTAILFTVGKSLLGLYLGRTGIASAYGAAGGLVVILVWVYYSAQILLAGAVVTAEYSRWWGSRRLEVSAGASPT
jgi:membrane protein